MSFFQRMPMPLRGPLPTLIAVLTLVTAAAGTVERLSAQVDDSPSDRSGPCVLLRNDNVIFGEAEQQADWVVIRQGAGNEVRMPRSAVACWADSLRDLYQYRIDHRRHGDPRVHLRDARWCLRFGLWDLAAAELREIYRIDPDHRAAAALERQLRTAVRSAAESPPSRTSGDVAPAEHVSSAAADERSGGDGGAIRAGFEQASRMLELSPESIRDFARHVQPILLNRCGHCHSHQSDRRWQVVLPATGSRASARITRENVASSLAFIRLGKPAESELAIKAVQPHGGVDAPLDLRDARAIEAIRHWIAAARSGDGPTPLGMTSDTAPLTPRPLAPEEVPAPSGVAVVLPSEDRAVAPAVFESPRESMVPEPANASAGEPSASESWRREGSKAGIARPARLPAVENPFDPELFNRRYHPR